MVIAYIDLWQSTSPSLLSAENIIKSFYFDADGSPKYKNLDGHFPFFMMIKLGWKESKCDWITLTGFNWFIFVEV